MANTYLLKIDQLYIKPVYAPNPEYDETELVDVITRVDFYYEATSETGTVKKYKITKNLDRPTESEGYQDYRDVSYETVQDWVRLLENEQQDVYDLLSNQIDEAENQDYLRPEKLPWEYLPPGVEENE